MGDKSRIEWTEATWNPIRARNLATGGSGHYCVKAKLDAVEFALKRERDMLEKAGRGPEEG